MIKAKKLRINDIVCNNDNYLKVCQVAELGYHNSKSDEYDYQYNIICEFLNSGSSWSFTEDEIDGVKLTESILLETGFIKDKYDSYTYSTADVQIEIKKYDFLIEVTVINENTKDSVSCKYSVRGGEKPVIYIHNIQHLIDDVDSEDIDWKIK